MAVVARTCFRGPRFVPVENKKPRTYKTGPRYQLLNQHDRRRLVMSLRVIVGMLYLLTGLVGLYWSIQLTLIGMYGAPFSWWYAAVAF